jgi:hypothetical protein
MTAAKPPPERVTLYMQDDETWWVAKADDVEPSAIYILESAVEKRERALKALRALLEQALDSLESAIGWPGIVAADDALRIVEAIRHELDLPANAALAATKEEKSE